MLFNSIEFTIFLPVVFILYWFVTNKNLKLQNGLIVLSSYLFYGWWDWRFLSLIVFSSFVDYFIGVELSKTNEQKKRKLLLVSSILVNISFLGFFKYFNFFAESFADAFTLFGSNFEPAGLNIVLPVGISFYTFQTLSYSIDVYRRKLEPTKDIISFFAFVSFFPQLVAGPIERASNLLPQFYNKRIFEYDKAVDGLRQILWGLFKKMVIADNCAQFSNYIFENSADSSGSNLVVGAIFFAFQIYGDFSGYSDIAIGTSRLFGFNLKQNFNFPYFSRDIAEFWRRWHISLNTWFRDYLYIPLGGSRGGTWVKVRNIFIIFLVSGFWHGANWTFLIWGFLNACYFLPIMLLKNNRNNLDTIAHGRILPSIKEVFQMLLTFGLTTFSWIFFRSESLGEAFDYVNNIFSLSLFSFPNLNTGINPLSIIIILFLFIIIEWIGRNKKYAFQIIEGWPARYKFIATYTLIIIIMLLMNSGEVEFLYFQF